MAEKSSIIFLRTILELLYRLEFLEFTTDIYIYFEIKQFHNQQTIFKQYSLMKISEKKKIIIKEIL